MVSVVRSNAIPNFTCSMTNNTSHAFIAQPQLEVFESGEWKYVESRTRNLTRSVTNRYQTLLVPGEVRFVTIEPKGACLNADVPTRWRVRISSYYNSRFDLHWQAKLSLKLRNSFPSIARRVEPRFDLPRAVTDEVTSSAR